MLKKTLCTVAALALVATMSACSSLGKPVEPSAPEDDLYTLSDPRHPLAVLFEAIKNADAENLKKISPQVAQYEDNETYKQLGEIDFKNPIIKTTIKAVYKNLSYTVTDIEMQGDDKAVVSINVSYPDVSPLINSTFASHAPKIFMSALSGNLNKEQIVKDVTVSITKEVIKNPSLEMISEDIKVNCYKKDGVWQLNFDEALLNVCTANAVKSIGSLDFSSLIK